MGRRSYFVLVLMLLVAATYGFLRPRAFQALFKDPTAAALVGGPMVQIGNTDGRTAVVIAWRTEEKSSSRIDFGATPDYGSSVSDLEPKTRHALVLPNLEPNRRYHYAISGNGQKLAASVFQTGKTKDRPFRFAVLGDSGSGSSRQRAVARQIERQDVDFIVHTGDVVYWDGKDRDYQKKFYRPYRTLISRIPIFPVLGNHDVMTANGQAWVDNFVLPGNERYYSFDYADASFIVMDSNRVDSDSARWLEQALAARTGVWKFVVFHDPPFAARIDNNGNKRVRDLWVPVLERYRVDLVFSGHYHVYTRFRKRNGVTYIIEGVGGDHLRPKDLQGDTTNVVASDHREFGFGLVEVGARSVTMKHITETGKVVDSFLLAK